MDKYFYVDSINNNICRLENINTKEIIEVYNFILNNIEEGDYIYFNEGKIINDKEFKKKRDEEIRNKYLDLINN